MASPEGGVRNVKLDVIPSDLVESIEVYKTLSANQDGDAIGGSVNLVTKTVGDQPYVSTSAMGGYTNIVGGRGLEQFTGTVGSRFGENKRFGALIGGSYDWNGRGINDVEPSQGTNDFGNGPVPVTTSADIREYPGVSVSPLALRPCRELRLPPGRGFGRLRARPVLAVQ